MQTILIFGGPDPLIELNNHLQTQGLVANWTFERSGASSAPNFTAHLSGTLY